MTTQSEGASASGTGEGRQKISPGERWLLITEKAYAQAQKRGFVGGDPFEDWLAAEKEVDAKYDMDILGVFSQTDAQQLIDQIKGVFRGFGLGHLSLDAMLERHREMLTKLAAANSALIDATTELASQQAQLLQEATSTAVGILGDLAKGRVDKEGIAQQAELSTKAMENVLDCFKTVTESVQKT